MTIKFLKILNWTKKKRFKKVGNFEKIILRLKKIEKNVRQRIIDNNKILKNFDCGLTKKNSKKKS